MSKTDELKKLAEKLVGSAPNTRRASDVVEYMADKMGGEKDTETISEAINYLTENVSGGGGGSGDIIIDNWDYLFYGTGRTRLNDIDKYLKSKPTSMNNTFANSMSVAKDIDLPEIDTSRCTSFNATFGTTLFNSIPVLDLSSAIDDSGYPNFGSNYGVYNMFTGTGDSFTSGELATNVLKSLLTLPTTYPTKTLAHVGFTTTTQQNALTALPEWTELEAKGWTAS